MQWQSRPSLNLLMASALREMTGTELDRRTSTEGTRKSQPGNSLRKKERAERKKEIHSMEA